MPLVRVGVALSLWCVVPVAGAQPAWETGSFEEPHPEGDRRSGSATAQVAEPQGLDGTADPDEQADETLADSEPSEETAIESVLWAGLGVGARSLRVPTTLGAATTDTGPYLAMELGLELGFRRRPNRSFGLRADYATSAGLDVQEQRVAAPPRTYRARSHQVRGGLFAGFVLGSRVELKLQLDYVARNIHSLVPEAQTPSFTLSGPALVVGLGLRIVERRLWLLLEPEVQGIAQVGDQVTEDGAARTGIAGGGQGVLRLRLHGALSCELTYYESHARVGGEGPSAVRDTLRLTTLRLRGAL